MAENEPHFRTNPDLEVKDLEVFTVPKKLRLEGGLNFNLLGLSVHRPARSFPYHQVPAALIDTNGSRLLISTGKSVVNEDIKPFDVLGYDEADTDINFAYCNPRTLQVVTFNLPHLIALMKR